MVVLPAPAFCETFGAAQLFCGVVGCEVLPDEFGGVCAVPPLALEPLCCGGAIAELPLGILPAMLPCGDLLICIPPKKPKPPANKAIAITDKIIVGVIVERVVGC